MHALVSIRQPHTTAHCEATYELLEAYARDGDIRLDPLVNEGAASALLIVSDAMEVLGVERWDDVDRHVVSAASMLAQCPMMLPFIVRTVVQFRQWLLAKGRASDANLEDLVRFAEELPASDAAHATAARPTNRAERRAARSEARRSSRRGMS
jgi:hypothetical protein